MAYSLAKSTSVPLTGSAGGDFASEDLPRPSERVRLSALLVIEDDRRFERVRAVLSNLSRFSVGSVQARTSRGALSRIESHRYDLVIVDGANCDSAAVDLIRACRGRDASVPVVALMGAGGAQTREAAIAAGAVDCVACGEFGTALAEHLVAHIVDRQTVVARLRHAEAQARELESIASSGASAKAQFLAQMNHDLRTPLNAILGFSEIIRERRFGDDFERYTQYADNIHTSGQRLLAMIENMIAVSVGDEDNRSIRRKRVELGEIANAAIAGYESIAAGKHISVRLDRPVEPIRIVADADRVQQMVGNLLSNALRHTPEHGAVTVGMRARDDGVELFVSDTGTGIPKDMVDRVMEPFFRIENPANPTPAGAGLGLAIVKSLIEAHGGSVRIHSRMGIGTTVRLHFPCGTREKSGVSA